MIVFQYIRSFLCVVLLDLFLVVGVGLVGFPFLFMPKAVRFGFIHACAAIFLFIPRITCGIKYKVRGRHNLPKEGGYIVASKHQSQYETVAFHRILPRASYVLKRELTWIPFIGWHFWSTYCIAIDRGSGAKAMKKMITAAKRLMDMKHELVIFPEGTRTRPGDKPQYHSGIAFLYDQLKVPVVPVAINSGKFWGKKEFLKRPGTIIIDILPPIAPGKEKRAFLTELENTIEDACKKL